MADTARKGQQTVQYFDSPEALQEKAHIVAELILNSKHFIAFTGAGISTACGIPDFRSGMNTVLKTGAGVWEKRAHGVKEEQPNQNIVDRNRAIPSFTHMSLVALERAKILKFLVSQNTDGLHLRSQFDPSKLAELHGNRMLQKCRNCGLRFLRDFITREAKKALEHQTSRKCQQCGNTLEDSIINFGQNLPEHELAISYENAKKADVCLALGSSLTVQPANDIPRQVGKHGKLVIVNLQKTPLDNVAFVRVHAMCDEFMKLVMEKLNVKAEQFILHRLIEFTVNKDGEMEFRGVDRRGIPFTYFKQVSICYNKEDVYESLGKKQPYRVSLAKADSIKIKFQFYGWLKQPPVQIEFDKEWKGVIELLYDPETQQWSKPNWIQKFVYQK